MVSSIKILHIDHVFCVVQDGIFLNNIRKGLWDMVFW